MNKKKINCLICGADDGEILIDREFPRHYVCRNCGFVYMNPIPDFEMNKEFYDQNYWKEHHGMTGLKRKYKVSSRQRRIQNMIEPFLEFRNSILEIGCGFGFNLDYIKQNNSDLKLKIEGLEISNEASQNVEMAFEITCHKTTIEEFIPSHSYNVIIMSHVLEHFENPNGVLGKVYQLLDHSGLLWLEVPNIKFPNPTKNLNKWLAKEHISYFSPDKLKYLLESNGFKIVLHKHLHYVCFLAQKAENKVGNARYENEYKEIKEAIRKQKRLFKWHLLKTSLGIKTSKYK